MIVIYGKGNSHCQVCHFCVVSYLRKTLMVLYNIVWTDLKIINRKFQNLFNFYQHLSSKKLDKIWGPGTRRCFPSFNPTSLFHFTWWPIEQIRRKYRSHLCFINNRTGTWCQLGDWLGNSEHYVYWWLHFKGRNKRLNFINIQMQSKNET